MLPSAAMLIPSHGVRRREPGQEQPKDLHDWWVHISTANKPLLIPDGEAIPYEEFHVELMPALGRVLSLDGHFFVNEFLQRTETKA